MPWVAPCSLSAQSSTGNHPYSYVLAGGPGRKNRERIRPGSAHKKLPSSRYALAN
jgi:hypothetical protein